MTEFRSGAVRGDQDFGNNILLKKVNEEINAAAAKKEWDEKGASLLTQLLAYLEDQRVRDPVGETVEEVHETGDGVILVFGGDRYYTIEIEGADYECSGYVTTGDALSVETARRCDLLQGVADIDKAYKEWQLEDVKRREENNAYATFKQLKTTLGKEHLKRLLEDDDA